MPSRTVLSLLILNLLFCAGCGESGPERKETAKVTGQVFVDGKPADTLQFTCHDKLGVDKELPTYSSGITDAEGKFELNTYEKGDGVPPGKYAVTFVWGEYSMHTMQYGGPDKLQGRYSDAQAPQFEFAVESGEKKDLGKIELTTKGEITKISR